MSSRLAHIALLLAVISGAAVYAFIGNPLDPFDNCRFSAEKWRAATREYDVDTRAKMARDLSERLIRPGSSESEVVALLGAPDHVEEGKDPGDMRSSGARFYKYDLGSFPWYGFDDAYLYVDLDSQDRVVACKIDGY